jgi:branched-chain amino acid transport system substrate-binding protein
MTRKRFTTLLVAAAAAVGLLGWQQAHAQNEQFIPRLVYHDSAYGKEPIRTLQKLAGKYGYELKLYAVNPPGLQQTATWLQIHQDKPKWVLMWGWGVMNSTAIKEAANVGYPMDHFIGNWWSGAEPDVLPAGEAAKGYKAANFNGIGTNYPAVQDILKYVYAKGDGHGPKDKVGEVLYNRGLVNALYDLEAIRTAQEHYGKKPLTGEQVQWGYEHLKLTEARIKQLGAEGLAEPLHLSCSDHEGGGRIRIQQWDGKQWHFVSGWIASPHHAMIREMYKESALKYAKDNGLKPRDCSKMTAMR